MNKVMEHERGKTPMNGLPDRAPDGPGHAGHHAGHEECPPTAPLLCAPARYGLMLFGGINVGLGIAGMFLPLMPTTVFLLIALWAFSRSSQRFHRWLYTHPRFGKTLRDWHHHRAIPLKAKIAACGSMLLSLGIIAVFVAESWLLPGIVALCLAPIAGFIVTRPSLPSPLLSRQGGLAASTSAGGQLRAR